MVQNSNGDLIGNLVYKWWSEWWSDIQMPGDRASKDKSFEYWTTNSWYLKWFRFLKGCYSDPLCTRNIQSGIWIFESEKLDWYHEGRGFESQQGRLKLILKGILNSNLNKLRSLYVVDTLAYG